MSRIHLLKTALSTLIVGCGLMSTPAIHAKPLQLNDAQSTAMGIQTAQAENVTSSK